MVKSIALILLIVISSKAYSQDFSIEDEESAGANTLFAETIEHFKQHPVNLNVLETSELVELAIVSQEVIDKINKNYQTMEYVRNNQQTPHVLRTPFEKETKWRNTAAIVQGSNQY